MTAEKQEKQEQFVAWLKSVELFDELESHDIICSRVIRSLLSSVWEAAGSPQEPEGEREVKLEVFIHTNFEDGETLAETGNRILQQVAEDLRNGETSAGVDLIGTTTL